LQIKAPHLAQEWHPTKNGDLTPSTVSPYSMKKVWWKCERGHEWQASVSNRFQGRNCAQCSAELKSSFPEQAIVFYLSKYFKVTSRNKYDGWEIDIFLPDYNIGIEYDGVAYHSKEYLVERENRKTSALTSSGIDLIRVKENYAKDGIEGQTIWFVVDYSYKNLPQALSHLLEFIQKKTGINIDIVVDIEKDRIDILSQYTTIEKKNSFAAHYPELCAFWNYDKNNGLSPEQFRYMSNRKIWWCCPICKGEWQETIINVAKGNRCPYCSGHRVLKGYNDLETVRPSIALEWDYEKNIGLSPSDFTIGSARYVWWRCKNGHSWKAQIAKRNAECPYCSGRRVKHKNNEQWMKKYSIAKEFFIENGHLVVPAKYTCEDGMQLGMWVRTQRVAKKNGNLTEEQEHLLNEIGMVWELKPGVKKRTD
jgi:DNA-directed RNA polymerase subunit RPC12/RpoP